jgi:L-aminopeptidase/D-esterase-like protein
VEDRGWEFVTQGRTNSLTDVAGVRVGHFERSDDGYLSGTTAILFDAPTRMAGDVRGGGPGTREIDALRPENLIEEVHGVVLSGGSAYGLDAASGVMRYLEEEGRGYRAGASDDEVVPIVPGAVIFDLGRGGAFGRRPDAEFGYRAARYAVSPQNRWGRVGAGTGARTGDGFGGVGSASSTLSNGSVIAALSVVNARGSLYSETTGELLARDFERGDEFGDMVTPRVSMSGDTQRSDRRESGASPFNTTLVVVVTDVALTRSECLKMAQVGHDGLARAVRPVHSYFDGDVVFGGSCSDSTNLAEPRSSGDLLQRRVNLASLYEEGAACVTRSIVRACLG